MNIHPLVVHFPIALLIVYTLCEIVRFRAVQAKPFWFYLKAFLVIVGSVAAIVTLQTGELAEEALRESGNAGGPNPLIEAHSLFANIATWVYAFIALMYVIAWIHREKPNFFASFHFLSVRWLFVRKVGRVLFSAPVLIVLALVGLVAISVTGALGGAIVYGKDFDPFAAFVYNLFVQ